jgi:hypothetical protein
MGMARRSRQPEPVTGDFMEACEPCFTMRMLTGLVAANLDLSGLVTLITAGLKLDMHELCALRLDWGYPVPIQHKVAVNMKRIQALSSLYFQRTVIKDNAANTGFKLQVTTEVS